MSSIIIHVSAWYSAIYFLKIFWENGYAILHTCRSDRIQTLQTIIISCSQEALPVVGIPKHLTCLPEVPDRSTICSGGIYRICWFEVLFWKGHNGFKSCAHLQNSWFVYSIAPGTTEKKNFHTTTQREWQNTTSDRHKNNYRILRDI